VVPGCLRALAVDAEFAGSILLGRVEGDAVELGEALRCMTGAIAAVVLVEGYIQYTTGCSLS
jgi:hypothetical protein